jgi:hypothetical protein
VELYGSDRSETESETSEILSNSPKEMVKFYKKTDFKSERNSSNLPSTSSLPSFDKEENILIRTDNTAAMYNINKKSGAMNLYCTARKIWKLSERNYLILKAVHIPGRINVTTDRLSRLEMSKDYYLNQKLFQRIQKMWRYYPKVDLFGCKKNFLTNIYVGNLSKRSRQHRKCLKTYIRRSLFY